MNGAGSGGWRRAEAFPRVLKQFVVQEHVGFLKLADVFDYKEKG
jgi:hypothetical protein